MKTYLNKQNRVIRSNNDLPLTIIDIAQTLITLIPKIIGLFGKKYQVPKYIDKVFDDYTERYFLTIRWSDHAVIIGYYTDVAGTIIDPLIHTLGENEKDAKKKLYQLLVDNRYIV